MEENTGQITWLRWDYPEGDILMNGMVPQSYGGCQKKKCKNLNWIGVLNTQNQEQPSMLNILDEMHGMPAH